MDNMQIQILGLAVEKSLLFLYGLICK